jgi:hypothetical protein
MNIYALVLALLDAASSVGGEAKPGLLLVEGDLIFQNSRSTQSAAMIADARRYLGRPYDVFLSCAGPLTSSSKMTLAGVPVRGA